MIENWNDRAGGSFSSVRYIMINRNSYAEKCSIPVQISISEGHNFPRDVTVSHASGLG